MGFPASRPRRLRQNSTIRSLVREHTLSPSDLIAPLFIVPGNGVNQSIEALPGQARISIDRALEEAITLKRLGVPGVLLFGLPDAKDPNGDVACDDKGIVQQAITALKREIKDLLVIADLCFCEYTTHGHCGILDGEKLDNDRTLEQLARQAVSLAKAGADIVAPSGMLDGMVKSVRTALDGAGYQDTIIMSYAAKYASAFYGPFREAVKSAPAFGDRRSYQMDPANSDEALREIAIDIEEGADIVMVKPALPYLDIIARAADRFTVPIAAYNVSGEYAMIKAAGARGMIDEPAVILETLTSIKRAGAKILITYFAKEVAVGLG